jgi:hypothetical protein
MAQAYTLFAPRSLRNLYVQSMSHPSTHTSTNQFISTSTPWNPKVPKPWSPQASRAGRAQCPSSKGQRPSAPRGISFYTPDEHILKTQNRPHQFHPTTGKITLDTAPRGYPERWFPNCQGQSLISSATFAFECCSFVLPDLKHLALGLYGAPKMDQATIDLGIEFVEMPGHVGLRPAFAKISRDWVQNGSPSGARLALYRGDGSPFRLCARKEISSAGTKIADKK